MKAVLLDGSLENDPTAGRVRSALQAELLARGWQVQHILLREQKIGNCAGDFFCWVRSPGMCNVDDDNREIAAAIAASDLMVYMTPVTFGGYSSTLKRMVDHQIQNISPFFANIGGETHHQKRYKKYPDFVALGWMEEDDAGARDVFRRLVRRNAINFYARSVASGLVLASQADSEIATIVRDCFDHPAAGQGSHAPEISERCQDLLPDRTTAIRRALLLVGSPRTRTSTSASLGGYLVDQLGTRAIETDTIYLHTVLRSPARMQALFSAVDTADLVLLAFPLYVDSLPGAVIEALERIAAQRAGPPHGTSPSFGALVNCGFPEAAHNTVALEICRVFARQAGFAWAGSLALGAGHMVHGAPLNELGGRAYALRSALEMAASALSQGNSIPLEAQDLLDRPVIPAWLYRLMGAYGWRQQAKEYGAQDALRRRTYLETK